VQDDVAGDFENEITDEKDTGAKAVHGFAELEVGQHLQFGKADVDAVQIRGNIAKEQQWQQTPRYLGKGGFFK